MVDTERVLEQMRAANPAPSLEQLAVDDLDLVRNIVVRERSATTTPMTEPPQTRPDLLTPRRRMRPVLVAGLAFILVLGTLGAALLLFRGGGELATEGFACPPGSTPDQPGPADQPRPPDYGGLMTFDPGTGQAFMLTRPGGSFWTFDVCTNTWTAAPGPDAIGAPQDFVYDVDSERAISFGLVDGDEDMGVVDVWAYEPATQMWTRKSDWVVGQISEWPGVTLPQVVYDPVTGLVVVREPLISAMWTYDVDTDTWIEIDQGTVLPPAVAESGPHVELLTYDASVDRLILYVASDGAARTVVGTWEFDIRSGRWEEQETNTPADPNLSFGWWPSGDEFAYDEANQVSVLYSNGTLATYDASEHSWTIVQHTDTRSATTRLGFAMTYDPVNERILVLGGSARTSYADVCDRDDVGKGGWCDRDDVIAFDVAGEEWIILLEPTSE